MPIIMNDYVYTGMIAEVVLPEYPRRFGLHFVHPRFLFFSFPAGLQACPL